MAGLLNQNNLGNPYDNDPYDLYDGVDQPYQQQQMMSGPLVPMQGMAQGQDMGGYGQPLQGYGQQPIYQEQGMPAIGAPIGSGYEQLPQDFGGVDNMSSIQGSLRNPINQMETLPDYQDMSGLGMGATAPKTFNSMGQKSFRKTLINDLLNMMGT